MVTSQTIVTLFLFFRHGVAGTIDERQRLGASAVDREVSARRAERDDLQRQIASLEVELASLRRVRPSSACSFLFGDGLFGCLVPKPTRLETSGANDLW